MSYCWTSVATPLTSLAACAARCFRRESVSLVDLQIASVALVHDLTLVTHNTKDYLNVPGLRLADWLTP
jgi:tRNA(fMet)-specific endonuclease VapC